MPRSRIKICGITNQRDAQQAALLGADAIGLNFCAASPRVITIGQAGQIVQSLPAFTTVVALLVNPTEQEVKRVLDTGLIDCLQFHGDESAEFCASFGVPFIKAIRVHELDDARKQIEPFAEKCTMILDTYVRGAAGGTGQVFDWSIARELVTSQNNPIILAGGLTSDNVALAIRQVQPYGVDVCSGVEEQPGVKDLNRMKRFFHAVASTEVAAAN